MSNFIVVSKYGHIKTSMKSPISLDMHEDINSIVQKRKPQDDNNMYVTALCYTNYVLFY